MGLAASASSTKRENSDYLAAPAARYHFTDQSNQFMAKYIYLHAADTDWTCPTFMRLC